MFYDRKIKYLDYLVNGERMGSGGFVKLEVRNGCLRMELSVTGLHPGDTFERDIMFCGKKDEKAGGRILISAGRGQFRQAYPDADNIGGTGIAYDELQGIRIPMGAGKEISCSWQAAGGRKEESERPADGKEPKAGGRNPRKETAAAEQRDRKAERSRSRTEAGRWREEREEPENGPAGGESKAQEAGRNRTEAGWRREEREEPENGPAGRESKAQEAGKSRSRTEAGRRREERKEPGNGPAGEKGEKRRANSGPVQETLVPLLENKWQQLQAIYPKIRPFNDGREYISIRPADFVLFPEESYKMANNSFLLHGYYNYRHLILARAERKGENCYYIGVPGNFYEKEKQVAIMFGFESFECAEEPAQAGDFGYYMMRTEL